MAINFLEQLAAEWYEWSGYFVRRNVKVGRRTAGGYECELDVVAFHPTQKKLVHIEPSSDAASWAKREEKYTKKFAAGRKYIPKLFDGIEVPKTIEQIALLSFASNKNRKTVGGGRIVTVAEFLVQVLLEVRSRSINHDAIPEQFVILRSYQLLTSNWTNDIRKTLFALGGPFEEPGC